MDASPSTSTTAAPTSGPAGTDRPLALVTGASSGIGLELARQFAENGFDVVVCAEDAELASAAGELRTTGAVVTEVTADLATAEGVESLVAATTALGRPLDALALNAGIGAGGAFLDRPLTDQLRVVSLNVTSVVHLAHRLLPAMVARGQGRVLVTSSVASTMPAPYNATYAASKAFMQSFTEALRSELKEHGVTVTALLPGPTETEFFERSDLETSVMGRAGKDDPAKVARKGFRALMKGKDKVTFGRRGKSQKAIAAVLPEPARAAMHGALSKPRKGGKKGEQGDAGEPVPDAQGQA